MPSRSRKALRLVPVSDVPKTIRGGIYVDLVKEFAQSSMKTARVEGAKSASAVSIRRAVAVLGLDSISVETAAGDVYLKKS